MIIHLIQKILFNIKTQILWLIPSIWVLFEILNEILHITNDSIAANISVIFLFSFAVVHGLKKYSLKDFLIFFLITIVISNLIENIGVITGIPYGSYHYSDELGLKLFLVPISIAPAYFSVGYLAYTLSEVLLNGINRYKVILVPVIASFIMVMWDLCMDPVMATIQKDWIWKSGGSYFGVPLSNFFGWFVCVFIIFSMFSYYMKDKVEKVKEKGFYLQAVIIWLVLSVLTIIPVFRKSKEVVFDNVGCGWSVAGINEVMILVTFFTMFFVGILSLINLMKEE